MKENFKLTKANIAKIFFFVLDSEIKIGEIFQKKCKIRLIKFKCLCFLFCQEKKTNFLSRQCVNMISTRLSCLLNLNQINKQKNKIVNLFFY